MAFQCVPSCRCKTCAIGLAFVRLGDKYLRYRLTEAQQVGQKKECYSGRVMVAVVFVVKPGWTSAVLSSYVSLDELGPKRAELDFESQLHLCNVTAC